MAKKVDKDAARIAKIDSFRSKENVIMPTTIIPLDIALNGGLIKGDMLEMAGESGVGKSTFFLDLAKKLMEKGEKVAYIDSEKGVKQDIMEKMGILPYKLKDQFLLLSIMTYMELEQAMEILVESDYSHIMIDSITTVIPSKALDKSVEDNEIGTNARVQTKFLMKWRPQTVRKGINVYFINQFRNHIGIGFGETTESNSGGSKALEFLCDVRLVLEKGPRLMRNEITGMRGKECVPYGNNARLWAKKYRGGRGQIKVPAPVIFGLGISNPYFYYMVLNANGYLATEKRTCFINDESLMHVRAVVSTSPGGELNMIKAIADNRDMIHSFLEERGHFNLIIAPAAGAVEEFEDEE